MRVPVMKRLSNALPDREAVAKVREMRQGGARRLDIIRARLGLPEYTLALVLEDVDSGGHDYDPVSDHVAIDRVVKHACGETWRRMSIWEQWETLAVIYERWEALGRWASEDDPDPVLNWGTYGRNLGWGKEQSIIKMAKIAYDKRLAAA